MKNIKLLALSGFVFLSQLAMSQNTNATMMSGEAYTISETGAAATGSQYYDDAFVPAKLIENNLVMIRYNAYSDKIEVKKSNTEMTALIPQKDFIVTTSNQKYNYEFVSYTTEDNENITGYLNRIVNNPNVKIYSRMKIILQKESAASNGYQEYKPANYKKLPIKYFIKIKDGEITELPANKKKAAKIFTGKESQILDFINSNKISLTEEADLKKLGDYLNTL